MDINVIGEPPIKTASTLQVLDPNGEAFNLGVPENASLEGAAPTFNLKGMSL